MIWLARIAGWLLRRADQQVCVVVAKCNEETWPIAVFSTQAQADALIGLLNDAIAEAYGYRYLDVGVLLGDAIAVQSLRRKWDPRVDEWVDMRHLKYGRLDVDFHG